MPRFVMKSSIFPVLALMLGVAIALGVGAVAFAEAENVDDLSENENCLDCHIDEEHLGLIEVAGPQVHNPEDGSLNLEAHAELACIKCHTDIVEIPHKEDVERTVNCLDCHDEQPE